MSAKGASTSSVQPTVSLSCSCALEPTAANFTRSNCPSTALANLEASIVCHAPQLEGISTEPLQIDWVVPAGTAVWEREILFAV